MKFRYLCSKRAAGWVCLRIVYVAGRWFPYNVYVFESYSDMIDAIND